MILSDRDIAQRLTNASLVITAPDPKWSVLKQLQPASVDVRLSDRFLEQDNLHAVYDTRKPPEDCWHESIVSSQIGFVLYPGMFVLGATIERVKLPADLVACVNGRSSLGRLGVIVHVTAGYVDPGFDGNITLELSNVGGRPVRLYPGMRIAQLVFYQTLSPAERPYGHPTRQSKYVGTNASGAVGSRIGEDK